MIIIINIIMKSLKYCDNYQNVSQRKRVNTVGKMMSIYLLDCNAILRTYAPLSTSCLL